MPPWRRARNCHESLLQWLVPPESKPMSERLALPPRLLTALLLALPLLAAAQISPSDLSAAEERAQREAERVFSVIKFHTIRSKPAAEAGKPRPPAARTERPAAAAPAPVAVVAQAPAPAASAPTAAELEPAPGTWQEPEPAAAPITTASSPAPTERDAEADEPDEAPLRLQNFVAPVVPPSLQATLGAGTRNVRVQFTVQPDGSVSQAEADAGVPRRLAVRATEAIRQWQFAPLPRARTAEVDIAFRRD